MMVSVGVIGLGNVGETIYHALKFYHTKVIGYDKYKPSDAFEEVIEADVIFIALPTLLKGKRLDNSIVLSTLRELEKKDYKGIVVLKSTLSIKTIEDIESLNLRILYMPEFLHERKRLQDFVRPNLVVIAGEKKDVDTVINDVFYWLEEGTPIFRVDPLTAIMSKLVTNAFASTKISFANEIRRICLPLGVNPKVIMDILVADKRAAPEYTDPNKGPFGGHCLPKDLEELINCTNKAVLLKAAKKVNDIVKKELREDLDS